MKKIVLFFIWIVIGEVMYGGLVSDSALKFNGYLELFYQYDFNVPTNHKRPSFVYDYTRHDELNVHLGFVKAEYSNEHIRGNLALGIGTYMEANYATEPNAFKNIFEANVGIKLARQKEIWLDMGIIPSHIGLESGIGKLNNTLTRSVLADNVPFYETGLKLSITHKKWVFSGLWLTGWARIRRLDGNSTPNFGTQVVFSPSNKLSFNSSTFLGSDFADTARRWRYFHDFYTTFIINPIWSGSFVLDVGMQQKEKRNGMYDIWWASAVTIKAKVLNNVSLTGRLEYYTDRSNVIIGGNLPIEMYGSSLNIDYQCYETMLLRLEGRVLTATEDVFFKNDIQTKPNDFFLTAAVIVSL